MHRGVRGEKVNGKRDQGADLVLVKEAVSKTKHQNGQVPLLLYAAKRVS